MKTEAPRFYSNPGLNIQTYDLRCAESPALAGDLDFYVARARRAGGPVLELGSGTGRVAIALAVEGISVTGLDRSTAMIDIAEKRRALLPEPTAARIRYVHGDMADFSLEERFGMVVAAFRSFQSILEPTDQRRCLECVRRHLKPGGVLVLDLFDPRFEYLLPGGDPPRINERVRLSGSGNEVGVGVEAREVDPLRQVVTERWRFVETDAFGRVVREEVETLRLRWTYRHEMRYLLELCGFDSAKEVSDFRASPPAYGKEQIWVARAR